MRWRVWAIVGVLIIVVLGAIFVPRIIARVSTPAPPQLATASRQSFNAIVTASGSVVPANQVNVNFAVPGTLTEIDVAVGDKVHKGQVLARIAPTNGQSAVASAQASVQAANAAVTGASAAVSDAQSAATILESQDQAAIQADCSGPNANSKCPADNNKYNTDKANDQRSIDQARAQLGSAQAQAAQAQAQLQAAQTGASQSVLTAPIDGTALAINGHVGETVAPFSSAAQQAAGSTAPLPGTAAGSTTITAPSQSNAFVVLGDNTQYQVVAPFAEVDAAQLKAGLDATITFDAIPNLSLPAKVLAVSQAASVVSSVVNYYATIQPSAPEPRLKAGMTANIGIPVARADNAIAVPNQAIYTLDQKLNVDVWYQNRSVATVVQVGLIGDKLTEIKAGLKEGDQVVLASHHNQTQNNGSGPSLFGR